MPEKELKPRISPEDWETCMKVLDILKDDPLNNPDNQRFAGLITKIRKKAKRQFKQQSLISKEKRRDIEQLKQSTVAANALNNTTSFYDENRVDISYKKLASPRNCYACNTTYEMLHSHYHRLCPSCSEYNYDKRFLTIDLANRNVILTGGRVKVGYATALKLLRFNANLVVTTRFPALALENFKKEKDYSEWKHRLDIYGLDLRNLSAVSAFISYYTEKYESIDILINNAAQTIRYTDEYYAPLIGKEQQLLTKVKHPQFIANSTPLASQKALANDWATELGTMDLNRFGQPVDERLKTSWNSTMEEVPIQELLEVNLINQISPYLLIQGLNQAFKASKYTEKFIINVTSAEGQFSYTNKSIYHPHTNMTKAALNMMTLTSARAMADDGIYMNCVDVGWVSTGAIEPLRKKQFKIGYIPPLDSVDAAARILHPIKAHLEEQVVHIGKLLKNYTVEEW